jgi:hypothetical protein
MARKARSLRDRASPAFLMALADDVEESGAETLLRCLKTDPEVFWDLARKNLPSLTYSTCRTTPAA